MLTFLEFLNEAMFNTTLPMPSLYSRPAQKKLTGLHFKPTTKPNLKSPRKIFKAKPVRIKKADKPVKYHPDRI